MPVSLAEAKMHLRVDAADEDGLIAGLIAAATAHLDGWAGVLGRCLCEQTWRQDFDRFARVLRLPLGPVASIASVTWRNAAGQVATVAGANYLLRHDAAGSYLRFRDDFDFPTDLHCTAAVIATSVCGTSPEDTPAPIKAAMLLLVGHWYRKREDVVTGTIATQLPASVSALIAPYRRVGI